MVENPLVSILIPTFNQDTECLKACIESAIAQDYPTLEIIVSDNHSTGLSGAFIADFSHPRVRIVRPPQFVPMTENFAYCARAATGKFLSFLSSDDILFPRAISTLYEAICPRPDVVFCCGNIVRSENLPRSETFDDFLIRRPTQKTRTYDNREAIEFFFPWSMQSTWMAGDLIRREAYLETGGFECCELGILSDIWLTKALLKCGGFAYLAQPLAFYRARSPHHQNADPSRPLLELSDQILIRASSTDLTPMRSISKLMHHLYLINSLDQPADSLRRSYEKAIVGFTAGGRLDLVKALTFYKKHPMLWKLLSWPAKALVAIKTSFDRMRA